MSKQITIVASDGETKKDQASAGLIGLITILIMVAAVGAGLYFLIKWISPAISFIFQIIAFTFYLVDVNVLWKSNGKRLGELAIEGKTYRDFVHEIMKVKPVAESTDEEKKDTFENFSLLNIAGIILTAFLWITPLAFGITEKYQVFPLNILAVVATIVGLVSWRSLVLSNSKFKAETIDEKVTEPKMIQTLTIRLVAIPMSIYAIAMIIYSVALTFGIDLIPLLNQLSGTPR